MTKSQKIEELNEAALDHVRGGAVAILPYIEQTNLKTPQAPKTTTGAKTGSDGASG
ncbi:MAG: hypothetical protein KDJ77_13150 [Rhodobiaceae bacterium]|nr:hypothetical protein [Rhodobiaceae bacterium]